jgi:hypothetical protein
VPSADPVRPILQQALAGRLPAAPLCDPIDPHDTALDPDQRDAVARAVASPDLLVIRGPVGTGKTRVAAEIVRQFVRRSGKVLLLSPEPAALDAKLTTLTDLAIVRRLAPGEAADRLPAGIADLVPGRREQAIRDGLLRKAAEGVSEAEERLRVAERHRTIWSDWTTFRETLARHTAERNALAARRNALADEVGREADATNEPVPFFVQRLRGTAGAHARRIAALDATATDIAAARAEAEERKRTAEATVHELKPKADALQAGRWYTPSFWKAKFDGTLAMRLAGAEAELAGANEAMAEVVVREQKLAADRQLAAEEFAAERARFLDAEVTRRQTELDARLGDLERQLVADAAREAERARSLRDGGIGSADQAAVDDELAAARRALDFARGWANEVHSKTKELVREACAPIQIVAGPVAGISSDPTAAAHAPFDVLVIDDAHRLAEPEFTAAARLARRWVLIGEPADIPTGRARGTRPDLFARLPAALRHDIWIREESRLVCRLYPVRGADRRRLECEPVVDAPDIELRLYTPPGGEPALAEVGFPDTTAPAAAREYLVRELGEVTCEPHGRTAIWEAPPAGPAIRFAPADPAATFAEIGPGIREELAGLETRAIHFDGDWSLDRAKEWAAANAGQRAGGRLVTLTRSHRACPGLAHWLNRAFDAGFVFPNHTDMGTHVEFLAVPDADHRRRHNHGRPGRVGGAGYEVDLADPRQRATLPPEFADLPAAGFVNLPEAQAVVRYIESLATPGVAVSAPFSSQVALLRKLLARLPRLAAVTVVDAANAAQQECDVLAVSLTRSHVARAVTFGDGPGVLAGLVGCARKKVLFAGDPGTLARRLQWEGPVDHLDATEAARERAWVAALADCPRVTTPRPRPATHESVRA